MPAFTATPAHYSGEWSVTDAHGVRVATVWRAGRSYVVAMVRGPSATAQSLAGAVALAEWQHGKR